MLSSPQARRKRKKAALRGKKEKTVNLYKPHLLNRQELLENINSQKLWALGTKYVFDYRIVKYGKLLAFLSVLGLITPLLFGGFLLTFDLSTQTIKILRWTAGILSIIQLILSAIALIYKWGDIYGYSQEAAFAHLNLYHKYKQLDLTKSDVDLKCDFEKIESERSLRDQQDLKYPPPTWLLRMGMRYSLLIEKQDCAGCDKIPVSMRNEDCDVCGNFSFKYKYIPWQQF